MTMFAMAGPASAQSVTEFDDDFAEFDDEDMDDMDEMDDDDGDDD